MENKLEDKEALRGILLITLFQGLALLFFYLIN